jgi:outer membrane protein
MKKSLGMLAAVGVLGAMGTANAADCLFRAGVHSVNPNTSNTGAAKVDVSGAQSLSINGACFVTPKLAIDVLGALPFQHDIKLKNGPTVGSTRHLPPTIGVQYHFAPTGSFDPYIGGGLNYTFFFSTKTTGALAGTRLDLGSSLGLAAVVGGDFHLANNWLIGVDVRYMKIKSSAKLNGNPATVGDVTLDPMVYGVTIGKKFSL